MSDTKENEEAGQNVPLAVEEVLAEAQVEPEVLAAPLSVGDTSNHAENGKVEAEAPVEDRIVKPEANSECIPQQDVLNSQNTIKSVPVMDNVPVLNKTEGENALDVKSKVDELPKSDKDIANDSNVCQNNADPAEMTVEVKPKAFEVAESKNCNNGDSNSAHPIHNEPKTPHAVQTDIRAEVKTGLDDENKYNERQAAVAHADNGNSISQNLYFLDPEYSYDGNESGTEDEQSAFMKELETFFRERSMEFKPPKFYKEGLNCLKLWRSVNRLGGYDKVTSCKLWRQVGESFKPPKTCTTVSWTFRVFYEKALLDYERHKTKGGELNVPITSNSEPMNNENQVIFICRARRDAAARAMQGWHSQRLLGNGEVSDPIIKDRSSLSMQKREKQLRSINVLKRKKSSDMVNAVKVAHSKPSKPQLDTSVIDIGPPADWVKINVQKTKDCFEVYALVPGLLREEVRVQSDPAGRLVISGEPEHSDNPWGVTPFKKVVSLPSRIDTHQTSAVVTLHGQLFVRVPFEQSE
ncbi:HSP20-like chaperone [Vigna unguiculata]|uniref:HSP20-like chaperone n=1 Tax=Vigna unguiculata TaxID=3917 RepID=A0A4D6L124_VIGUN|nr:HSP20-like chaperone [Vigna unguiculata]